MVSESRISIDLGGRNGGSVDTESLIEDPLKKLRISSKIINETDEYTEELFNMLKDEKEDEFIEFIEDVRHHDNVFPKLNCSDGVETYLKYACRLGLDKVAKYLIDSGVDLSAVCYEGADPPLYTIVHHNFVIAKYMIEKDLNQLFMHYNNGNVLHQIAHIRMECSDDGLEFLKYLLEEIKDLYLTEKLKEAQYLLNEEDFEGKTPLNIAVENGFESMILVFLENGVDMFKKNKRGECGFLHMNPNLVEEYFNRKVDFIEKHNEIEFDYTSIVPPECFDYDNISEETSRITYLSQLPDFKHLIKHPVVSTFIHLKGQKVKWLFYLNLLVYVIFCCLFTLHILVLEEGQAGYSKTLVTIVLSILAGRELLQVYMSPLDYIRQRENWIVIPLVVTTLLTMFSNTSVHQQISSVAILLTWTELLLLLGRDPNLSTLVEMYKRVSLHFFKYLYYYFIFIIVFSFSYYVLFQRSDPKDIPATQIFSNVTTSMFETILGFLDLDPKSPPVNDLTMIGRIFTIMFVLLIFIIMLNLLNGLAVSDTQSIIDEAELLALISRLKFISLVEKNILIFGKHQMYRIKLFYRPKVQVKGRVNLFVSGNHMEAEVLKAARQIKRVYSGEKSENKLNTLLIRVDNIEQSVEKNMILLDNKINSINKSVDKNIMQLDNQIKYLSDTLKNLMDTIDLPVSRATNK